MTAWLGMYDMPHLRSANDTLWQAIRARLGFGPDALSRATDPWPVWQDPDLILAQTCSLPFRALLSEKVQLVGTPDYDLPGCPAGYYRSVLVAKKPLSQCQTFAYNDRLSQSGWAAAQPFVGGLTMLDPTGSHAASATAVAKDVADVAALDAVTWRHIQSEFPDLTVVAETDPTPGLPLITSQRHNPDDIAQAVRAGLADALDAAHALNIRGLVSIPADTYLGLPLP